MEVRFRFVRPFRDAVGKSEIALEVGGDRLTDALAALTGAYPPLADHLYENGQLSTYVNIYLNGTPVEIGAAEGTRVSAGDEILFLLPLTGGFGIG